MLDGFYQTEQKKAQSTKEDHCVGGTDSMIVKL